MPHKPHASTNRRAYTLPLDREDERSPVVVIMQDGEATIYLTLKEAKYLSQELTQIIQKFEKP